jgi:hypothetical protein
MLLSGERFARPVRSGAQPMAPEVARRVDDMSGTEARELLAKLLEMALNPNYDNADLGDDVRITLAEAGFEVEVEQD